VSPLRRLSVARARTSHPAPVAAAEVDAKLPKVALRQPEIRHGSRNARFGPSTSRQWSAPTPACPTWKSSAWTTPACGLGTTAASPSTAAAHLRGRHLRRRRRDRPTLADQPGGGGGDRGRRQRAQGNRTDPRRAPASVGQHPAAACRHGPDRRAGHGRRPARGDPHGRSCVERAGGDPWRSQGGAEAGGRPGHPGDPGRPHGGARVHRGHRPGRTRHGGGLGYRQLRPHHLHPSMAEVVGLAIRLDDLARNA
jgi:hypothetical protein